MIDRYGKGEAAKSSVLTFNNHNSCLYLLGGRLGHVRHQVAVTSM